MLAVSAGRNLATAAAGHITGRAVRIAAAAALTSFLSLAATVSSVWAIEAGSAGIGFNTVDLRRQPWVIAVEALPNNAAVVSDNPFLLRWLTGREPVKATPTLAFYTAASYADLLAELRAYVAGNRPGYLVRTTESSEGDLATMRASGFAAHETSSGTGYTIYRPRSRH